MYKQELNQNIKLYQITKIFDVLLGTAILFKEISGYFNLLTILIL
jgi:hypothetical protein